MRYPLRYHMPNMAKAEVTKIMSKEGPRKIIEIDVDLHINTVGELDEKQKVIFERIAKNCPVALSLHPDVLQKIIVDFTVI